ncbi:hypothetical protein CBL_08292 [Carabus blaptoides fortunei]
MASLVCNCNTYGNIDYGVPVLFKSADFRTSTGVGLRNITPQVQEFYSTKPQLFHGANEQLVEVTLDPYRTTNSIVHGHKYQKYTANELPKMAACCARVQCMRSFKEKMFKMPVAPRPPGVSEYTCEYQLKITPDTTSMPNVHSQTTCAVSRTGDQSRVNIESPGVTKLLDPYATTTGLAYIEHGPNQLEISRKYITTYYDSDKHRELTSHLGKKPMKDDSLFKADVKDRIVPKLVYRVPYTGKTSEYTGNYRPPTTGCTASHTFDSGTEFPDSLSEAINKMLPSDWSAAQLSGTLLLLLAVRKTSDRMLFIHFDAGHICGTFLWFY